MKNHLAYLEGPLVVCGQHGVRLEQKVHSLGETTCKRCIKVFEGNKDFYAPRVIKVTVGPMKFDSSRLQAAVKKVSENLEKNRIRRSKRAGYCGNCGNKIKVMCFIGTNHCSENCRKTLQEGEQHA